MNLKNLGLKCITNHWSAGSYTQTFDDYHFCITWDGKKAQVIQTLSLTERGSHCWRRNTGNIGVSMMCMAEKYPVRLEQVEAMAKLNAELCLYFGLDPNGTYTAQKIDPDSGAPIFGAFEAPIVSDHAFYARKDGYSSLRWDIGNHMAPVKAKTLWYYNKLKSGEIKPEYTVNLH